MREDNRDALERDDDRQMDTRTPDSPDRARLVHLDEVKDEFKVAEDDPDIRGWDVRGKDGRTIGKVNDLIVDTGLMKVRYLEVKVDKDALGGDDDRYILLPVGEARVDEDEDDVYVNLDATGITGLPAYDPSRFDRGYETSLRDSFTGGTHMGAAVSGGALDELAAGNRVPEANRTDDDFYTGDTYDEGRFFGRRRAGHEGRTYIERTTIITSAPDRERPLDASREPMRGGMSGDSSTRPPVDRRDDEPRSSERL